MKIIETNLKLKRTASIWDLFFFSEYIDFSSLLTFSEKSKITFYRLLNLFANKSNYIS